MPSSTYGRLGYMALKTESSENTAVKPDTFIQIMKEDVVPKYDVSKSMPVAGTRALNLRALPNAIQAPSGKIAINVEPKTFGYFLKGCYGAETVGRYIPISGVTGTFQVGETITGGTSSKTATIVAISSENDYLLTSVFSGALTTGETITGGTSSATAVIGATSTSVYGHQFIAPTTTLPTFTVEFGYANEAVRYTGVRFNGLTVNQKDNIITAEVMMTALAEFKHARVTAITTAGSTKTISVDQTTGLVAADSIKIYRPSTNTFVESNTISSITSETAFVVGTLANNTAVGDLIVLAPQTASYSVVDEFTWVGGSSSRLSETSMSSALSATAEGIEDFEINLQNEIESRHASGGANVVNRFPASNHLKGLTGSGKLDKVYTDMTYLDRLRKNRQLYLQVKHQGNLIGSTALQYTLDFRAPKLVLNAFNPTIENDALLDQKMPYELFYDTTAAYMHKALLINDISAY